MIYIEIIFWISLWIVFYTYIGYGILLEILVFLKHQLKNKFIFQNLSDSDLPTVTFIIPAYNERDWIIQKIQNTLALDYPKDKIQFWVVTDGSTDGSQKIVAEFSEVQIWHQTERKGKINAMNRVMNFVKTEIAIFSDANTFLPQDAIRHIVKHYQNPKVGAVAGEKRIMNDKSAVGNEGIYWKYESWLKKQDAQLYSIVGAAGELFSCRSALYTPIDSGIILDDFVISLQIAQKGYVVAYESNAYALEACSASITDEWKRKTRISAGGIQAIVHLKDLFNIFKFGMLSFQFISHRVLRWTLTPLLLPILLLCNFLLLTIFMYQILFLGQIIFYCLSWMGWLLKSKVKKIKILFIPFYFVMMNLSVMVGWIKYFKGKQTVLWEKAERKALSSQKI
jgi:cellulose synthase/poly-beta-1,6-N-acetylglucosamine synthase-like glycosyltransferase